MQCKCGGSTKDREVVRKDEVVARYARCVACGFVSWRWFGFGWTREVIVMTGRKGE